jgi:glutathione peroxidase
MLTIALAMASLASFHDFTVRDIDGKDVPLGEFRGKVCLVVNVASQCGLTPQYAGLQALFEQHKEAGLVVLGFPSNDFGAQEPGTEAEIKEFCTSRYAVTFPMFAKVHVNGPERAPVYKWLIGQAGDGSDIEWNFGKFLVGRDGRAVARFSPRTSPDDPKLVAAIEAELGKR